MMRFQTLALGAVVLAFACGDFGVGPHADLPLEYSDARNGGPHPSFYFLPPIADAPDLTDVELDRSAEPAVAVCEWADDACAEPVWDYGFVSAEALSSGQEAQGVRRDADGGYVFHWAPPSSERGVIYQISVRVGGRELGWAQVEILLDGRARVPGQGGGNLTKLPNGRFPIRFVVGEGEPLNEVPSLAIAAPAADTVAQEGDAVTFAAAAQDAEDGDLGAAVTWSSDVDGALGTGATMDATLSAGAHVVTAKVHDSFGDSAMASVALRVNAAPTLSITAPSDGAVFGDGATVGLAAAAQDAEDGDLGGSVTWSSDVDGALGTGATLDVALSTGSHVITATVADADGAAATATAAVHLNATPVVAITAPADGGVYPEGAAIAFSGTAADAEQGDLSASLSWSSDVDGALGTGASIQATLSPGSHVVTATAADADGDAGSAQVALRVNSAPTLSVVAPPDGSIVDEGSATTFTATAQDAEDGDLSGAVVWTSDVDGTLGTGASLDAALTVGAHTVTASVTDSDGTSVSASVTLRVNAAPTASITSPADGASYEMGTQVTLTGTASDAEDGDLTGAISWRSDLDGPLGTGAQAQAILSAGTHTVTAEVTDADGSTASAAITVEIRWPINISAGAAGDALGAGLVTARTCALGTTGHGGVTVTVASDDASQVLVSRGAGDAAAASVSFDVADGDNDCSFHVHAVGGAGGSASAVVSAPTFFTTPSAVSVVQPGLAITGLLSSHSTLGDDDPFNVLVGVPNPGGTGVIQQAVRPDAPALAVSVTSGDTTRGRMVDGSGSGATATTSIQPGQSVSPAAVVDGGVAFDPSGYGSVTVTASAAGHATTPDGARTVFVDAPTISVASIAQLGAGLQVSRSCLLQTGNHPGVTVHVESDDPSILLVSPNATTAGQASIDINVPAGQRGCGFYLQGVEGTTGAGSVTVSAPLFKPATATAPVVQPAFAIEGLSAYLPSFGWTDDFYVRIGVATANGAAVSYQALRAGASPLAVRVSNDISDVANVVTSASEGHSATVYIQPGQIGSPTVQGGGGVGLRPKSPGTTNVIASITGFQTTSLSTVSVTVYNN